MDDVVAWGVVALAGLGTLAGVFVLTRSIPNPWLRSLLRCLAAVWLMLPWRIEVVAGHYAPAFVVALFEGVFRADGNARPALTALGLASLFILVLFLIVGAVRRWRAGEPDAAPVVSASPAQDRWRGPPATGAPGPRSDA